VSAQASLISDLEAAITSSGSDRRIEALRRVTDLFLANADRYEPEQIEVFDDVLGRMISHIESRALAELSRRIAPVNNAPLRVIRTLAMNDAIAVAGPVLAQSNRLSTSDLVNIATTKSQDHLLAICGRKEIAEAVTDVLVERGNTEVARKVAINQGARLSGTGYASLVRRAEHDDQLIDSIGRRTDISPQLFQELLRKATETVRARLLATRPDLEAGVSEAIQKASEELSLKVNVGRDYSRAKRLVQPLHHDGKLKEKVILGFARDKRVEDVVVAMSLLCSSEIEIIDRLMQGTHIDAALIPCKAAGFSWPTVKAVIQLNPFHRALTDARYEELHDDYRKLSAGTAQRIIRFWQVRSKTDVAETV
jgi:Uncharacterised protein conserved in bacteria (DUF2336)